MAAVVQRLIEQHLDRIQAPKVGDRVRILDCDWASMSGTLVGIGNVAEPEYQFAVKIEGYACERWVRSVEVVGP